jgi:hypothetical protein
MSTPTAGSLTLKYMATILLGMYAGSKVTYWSMSHLLPPPLDILSENYQPHHKEENARVKE